MIPDSHMGWIRKRKFYNVHDLFALEEPASGIQQAALTTGVTLTELGTSGFVGVTMTDGEFLPAHFHCPFDLDPRFELGFKVCYTLDHDGSGAATVSWILLCDLIAEGGNVSTVATTALDQIVPLLDNYGDGAVTDGLLAYTDRGLKLGPQSITRKEIESGAFIKVKIEMDAAINESSVLFLGLIMDYTPRKLVGMGVNIDSPLNASSAL